MHFLLSLILFIQALSSSLLAKDDNDILVENKITLSLRYNLRLKMHPDLIIDQHFFLRPMFSEDSRTLRNFFTNSKAMAFMGHGQPYTRKKASELIERFAQNNLTSKACQNWTLITYDGIGGFVLAHIAEAPDENYSEIIYGLLPSQQGRGLAYYAAERVIDHTKKDFIATVHPQNVGSIKTLERLGFSKDKTRLNAKKYGHPRLYYVKKKKCSKKNRTPL